MARNFAVSSSQVLILKGVFHSSLKNLTAVSKSKIIKNKKIFKNLTMLEYQYDVISLSYLKLFSEITNWVYTSDIRRKVKNCTPSCLKSRKKIQTNKQLKLPIQETITDRVVLTKIKLLQDINSLHKSLNLPEHWFTYLCSSVVAFGNLSGPSSHEFFMVLWFMNWEEPQENYIIGKVSKIWYKLAFHQYTT